MWRTDSAREASLQQASIQRVRAELVPQVTSIAERCFIAIQALHAMRPCEMLGLKWEDIDLERDIIRIRRHVTHPTRNLAGVGDTKTLLSKRDIAISPGMTVLHGRNAVGKTNTVEADGKKRKYWKLIGEDFDFCDSKDSPRGQAVTETDSFTAAEEDIPF